jgi:transcriptional regulator with XRE-family HTH domain
MANQRLKLSDQLRRAVKDCGMTRYRICQLIDMEEGQMSRFMSGKGGMSLARLDRLADCLGLELVARSQPQTKAARAKR